jgi:type I restriction enzyme M protein
MLPRGASLLPRVGLASRRCCLPGRVAARRYIERSRGQSKCAAVREEKYKSMMPTTKEAQRAEIHKTIWRIANDLRGSVDGWDFKSYVLGMLFYRFISENLTAYINNGEHEAGHAEFDYARLPDAEAEFGRKETVVEKGFYVLPSELFQNVRRRAAKDENLNETLERVFKNIEGSAVGTDSEDDLKGLFDDLDVNSSKLGNTVAKRNEKLVKLLDAIGDLPLGNFEDNSIDLFGDAYEYLMQMYASQAGKSGGEYYTPQEVSEVLARITVMGKKRVNKVYDPAAGSGSLLLKFAKVLGRENIGGYFGQEINLTTYNLARINMFLHDVNYEKFSIAHGDTLLDPQHWDDEPFEAIVSNPPYSIKWEGDANPLLINDERFAPAGVLAPKSKADLAFTMHILSWLAVNGTAAIVEFPGVLYRGGAEQKIRKYLIDNNYVDAVIQLPADLFFGTTIATCIIVLKKSKSGNSVLFVNASDEFKRVGNKNKLTPDNQQNILMALDVREDEDHFAKLVSNEDIAANDYNISVASYVEAEDTREAVDITALNAEIAEVVARQVELRASIDELVAELEGPK